MRYKIQIFQGENKELYQKILFLAFSNFLFYLVIQIDIVLHLLDTGISGLLAILAGQAYNIWISFIFSIFFLPLRHSRFGKFFFQFFLSALIIYLIIDRHFYALMFDHIQSGYLEGDANANLMKDSFISQITGISYFYIILGIIWVYWNNRIIHGQISDSLQKLFFRNKYFGSILLIALFIYSVYGFSTISKNDNYKLSIHPIITIIKTSIFQQRSNYSSIATNRNPEIFTLQYGNAMDDEDEKFFFKKYLLKRSSSKPNVIFILLESVGAKNIFKAGQFTQLDSQITPNLHSLKNNTVVFPYLYTQVPATTRTQFNISTGGYDMTYGSSTELLKYKFTGPTIFSSFKAAGYETGMFSAQLLLDAAYVYDKSPIDIRYIPDSLSENKLKSQRLNSWGIKEEYAVQSLKGWLDNRNSEIPFFIQFNTSCTHHPYNYPSTFVTDKAGQKTVDYYNNALGYTDQIIGTIIQTLKDKNLLNNTIIVLSGDHGESFGEWHKTNFLHKSFIYEENVRSFLFWIDQGQIKNQHVSNRKGSSGDIGPTFAGILNQKNNMPGQNLFSDQFKQRVLYFYKNANPAKWGLLDGEWKFIHNQENDDQKELYNLMNDPNEQNNLAMQLPERLILYNDMCRNWYISEHKQLAPLLSGYEPYYYKNSDLSMPGPKQIEVGIAFENKPFVKLEKIHPEASLGIYTRGIPFKENTIINYHWISPSGKKYNQYFEHDSKWSTAWINCNIQRPLETGVWKIVLSKEMDGKELISTHFEVSEKAPLGKKFVVPWLENIVFAKIDQLNKKHIQRKFKSNDTICVILKGKIQNESHRLILRWLSPSGQIENNVGVYYQSFLYERNWAYGWVKAPDAAPYEKGRWMLSIFDDHAQELLYSAWFEVE